MLDTAARDSNLDFIRSHSEFLRRDREALKELYCTALRCCSTRVTDYLREAFDITADEHYELEKRIDLRPHFQRMGIEWETDRFGARLPPRPTSGQNFIIVNGSPIYVCSAPVQMSTMPPGYGMSMSSLRR